MGHPRCQVKAEELAHGGMERKVGCQAEEAAC